MSSSNSPAIAPSPSSSSGATVGLMPKPITTTGVTKIVTSKEWVLPPRPKPGRKPSADTPATKRKAQNRAAQRAFRERRATRVSELEGRLSEVEKEKEINEVNLKSIVNKLQNENKFLLKALNDIKADYANFKSKVMSAQQANKNILNSNNNSPAVFSNGQVTASSPLNYFKTGAGTGASPSSESPDGFNQHYRFQQKDLHPQQLHRLSVGSNQYPQQLQTPPQPQHISPASTSHTKSPVPHDTFSPHPTSTSSNSSTDSSQFDCGVCVKDDCICAEVGIKPSTAAPQKQNAALSLANLKPMAPVSLKRRATTELEVDYTAKFSKTATVWGNKPVPKLKKFKKLTSAQEDTTGEFMVFDKITEPDFESQCGFCSDESNCVCAQAAKQAANAITELQNHSRRESKAAVTSQAVVTSQAAVSSQLPPISRHSSVQQINKLPVMHPGPSVEIPEHHRTSIPPKESVKTEQQQKTTGGCTGNPGTCSQCQLDPMSTLFCTTVAAKAEEEDTNTTKSPAKALMSEREKNSPVSPPISTHSSKVSSPVVPQNNDEELNSLSKPSITSRPLSSSAAQTPPPSTLSSISGPSNLLINPSGASTPGATASARGIYIPCADAYKTLSRHKEFNSVDFATLVGKLNTRGMQVEVQSVANVLRELDRRLYS